MPSIDIGDRELHVVRRGDGPPLLLIHGLAGTHGIWGEPFLVPLAEQFELITYDQRGIGSSSSADEPFTIADLADDAAALITALGIERTHVFGSSMGGMVAQELVLRHPALVDRLVLGCTYAGGPGSVITDKAAIRRFIDAIRGGDVEAVIQTGFELNLSAPARAREGSYRTYRTLAFAAPAPREVVVQQARATATHDTSARLGGVTAPTTIIHGDLDAMLVVENAHQIARLMPAARLDILEGVGHLFWVEQPQRAAELVIAAAKRAAVAS